MGIATAYPRLRVLLLLLLHFPAVAAFLSSAYKLPLLLKRIASIRRPSRVATTSGSPSDDDDDDIAANSLVEFGANRRDPKWQERCKRWILLVDDEEAIRTAVGQMLADCGYQVTTCADARTALQQILGNTRQLPDAIISDVRMPRMDGLEMLSELRSNSLTIQLPVVLLTAKGQTQDRIAGYQAGADAYLPKPFDPEELVAILDGLLEQYSQLNASSNSLEALARDVTEIKTLLLRNGGGGVGNGWVEATNVYMAPDERQILELLCQGLQNKEIAEQAFISKRRVEQLLTGMFRKTNTKNRTELVRWAVGTGNVQL
jgi:DNA-binding NarL/FixJ family response regulator